MFKVKYLTREHFVEVFRTYPNIAKEVLVGRLDNNPNVVFPILEAGPRQDYKVLCTIVIDFKGNTITLPIPGKLYDSLPNKLMDESVVGIPMKKEIL